MKHLALLWVLGTRKDSEERDGREIERRGEFSLGDIVYVIIILLHRDDFEFAEKYQFDGYS